MIINGFRIILELRNNPKILIDDLEPFNSHAA